MIACISPADVNTAETHNTLTYANRARNIRNKLPPTNLVPKGISTMLRAQVPSLHQHTHTHTHAHTHTHTHTHAVYI